MKHWFSDLRAFRRDPLGFLLEKGSSESGGLVRLRLGPPVYMVVRPDLVKTVLTHSEEQIDKGRLVQKLRVIVGDNSLTLSGEEHQKRRSVIHERLMKGISLGYTDRVSAIIRQSIFELSKRPYFDAHDSMAPLALRIISSILFGNNALSSADENALIQAVRLVEEEVADSMFRLLPTPASYFKRVSHIKTARHLMRLVVQRASVNADEGSLLYSLSKLGLSDEELCDEILVLFLAGHHTTGSAAAWVLYFMAIEPGLMDSLCQEASEISDENGEFDSKKLSKATVSLSLVKEVLRLYPSAWWYSRELKVPLQLAGKNLRPGTSLIISPWHLGRDPRYWERPFEFNLNRSHSNPAFLPFGAGARACVGMRFALLELQLLALNFASASCRLRYKSQFPAPPPKPLIALTPPEMKMSLVLHGEEMKEEQEDQIERKAG